MAQRALVDTTVLYAAANRSERSRHEEGLAIVKAADRGEIPMLLVSDAAWIETMNGLNRDIGHQKAREFARRLDAGQRFDVAREPRAVWDRGQRLFREHAKLSMGDALQLASARHREIEYIYSFDAGFDGFDGLKRLASPIDPFEP